MLNASITLGVMAIVVTLLVGLLSAFPLSSGLNDSANYSTDTGDTQTLNTGDVKKAGDLIMLNYTDLINDIASFQNDPSLERAEVRKNIFRNYAQNVANQFQVLDRTLSGKLNELAPQVDGNSE